METLPEYIEGIPTAKKRSSERFELIMSYYSFWTSTFLSLKKKATKRQQEKRFIIGNRHTPSKILLYYNFIDEKRDYLNFRAKLTIGVMTDGKHVQYCVNKIEAK